MDAVHRGEPVRNRSAVSPSFASDAGAGGPGGSGGLSAVPNGPKGKLGQTGPTGTAGNVTWHFTDYASGSALAEAPPRHNASSLSGVTTATLAA